MFGFEVAHHARYFFIKSFQGRYLPMAKLGEDYALSFEARLLYQSHLLTLLRLTIVLAFCTLKSFSLYSSLCL